MANTMTNLFLLLTANRSENVSLRVNSHRCLTVVQMNSPFKLNIYTHFILITFFLAEETTTAPPPFISMLCLNPLLHERVFA